MKLLNNLVSFLLELAMLGALSFWGFHAGSTGLINWLLGLGIPLLVVIFWGTFMAPNAKNRIAWPWLPVVSLLLFLISAAALYSVGERSIAVAFAATAIVNSAFVFMWHQY